MLGADTMTCSLQHCMTDCDHSGLPFRRVHLLAPGGGRGGGERVDYAR